MKKTLIYLTITLFTSSVFADGKQQRSYDNFLAFTTAGMALAALILAGQAYKNSLEPEKKAALDMQKEMNEQPIQKVESINLPAKPPEMPAPKKDDGFSAIEVGGYGPKADFEANRKKLLMKSSDGETVDPKNTKVHNYDEATFGSPMLKRQQPNDGLTVKLKKAN